MAWHGRYEIQLAHMSKQIERFLDYKFLNFFLDLGAIFGYFSFFELLLVFWQNTMCAKKYRAIDEGKQLHRP